MQCVCGVQCVCVHVVCVVFVFVHVCGVCARVVCVCACGVCGVCVCACVCLVSSNGVCVCAEVAEVYDTVSCLPNVSDRAVTEGSKYLISSWGGSPMSFNSKYLFFIMYYKYYLCIYIKKD